MQHHWFDDFTRNFQSRFPRRRALGLSVGIAAMSLLGQSHQAKAGCKKVGKKCDKNKDCCDHAKCKGKECKCKSGFDECGKKCYDLDKDENHCGACDVACGAGEVCCDGECANLETSAANCSACGQACGASETCVAGVCTTAEGCPVGADACAGDRVSCGDNPNCICSLSTEGETRCGDPATPGALCGQCVSSTDCEAFGPGAFCVETGSDSCCGPNAQNVCRLACSADR